MKESVSFKKKDMMEILRKRNEKLNNPKLSYLAIKLEAHESLDSKLEKIIDEYQMKYGDQFYHYLMYGLEQRSTKSRYDIYVDDINDFKTYSRYAALRGATQPYAPLHCLTLGQGHCCSAVYNNITE